MDTFNLEQYGDKLFIEEFDDDGDIPITIREDNGTTALCYLDGGNAIKLRNYLIGLKLGDTPCRCNYCRAQRMEKCNCQLCTSSADHSRISSYLDRRDEDA